MPRALILAAVCLFARAVSAEVPETAGAVMRLARHRTVAAKFVQTRHLAELDMDVEARGSMVSELDGRLRWQVDYPVRSVTLIDREQLTHYDGETGRTAVIPQERFPWLRILRESLDDWLSGDPKRLVKRFKLSFSACRKIRLTPREAALKKLCRAVDIELAGDASSIRRIRIFEEGGDTLDIRFDDVRNDPKLPPDIWRMPPR